MRTCVLEGLRPLSHVHVPHKVFCRRLKLAQSYINAASSIATL